MDTTNEHMQDLSLHTNQDLEKMVKARFFWSTSATEEQKDYICMRQRVAEELLAERRGTPLTPRSKIEGSIWSKSRTRF